MTSLSGIQYEGRENNFERDFYSTIEAMVAASSNPRNFPSMFIAMCGETGGAYLYNKNNETIDGLGKWRALNLGGEEEEETDTIDFSTWEEFTAPEANGIVLDGQGGANVDGSNVGVDPDDIEPDD